VLYLSLTSVIAQIQRLPVVVLFVTVMALLWFPGFSGRIALRVMGIGGGIPAQVVVKTMDVGSSNFVAETRIGCLILNAGGQVIIRRMNKPTAESCGSALFADSNLRRAPLHDILSYSILNVLEVTRYEAPTQPQAALGG
jgi:hypothetical protein